MSIKSPQDWSEVEARAKRHEASVSALMTAAGLPPLRITPQDRVRGAVVSAITEIELGHSHLALSTLKDVLKLL